MLAEQNQQQNPVDGGRGRKKCRDRNEDDSWMAQAQLESHRSGSALRWPSGGGALGRPQAADTGHSAV